jgi:hypothetical protein
VEHEEEPLGREEAALVGPVAKQVDQMSKSNLASFSPNLTKESQAPWPFFCFSCVKLSLNL